ncbi:DUF1003 domain-containing protein [Pannus brasiliensis CCIBt3594]|uniref:DUF1003 domain-containing protein n=1 Tax=Pannus brasiliensis CCIBt3594 TaxID=1427578 RepID=A0AAW9QRR1_9CHRO
MTLARPRQTPVEREKPIIHARQERTPGDRPAKTSPDRDNLPTKAPETVSTSKLTFGQKLADAMAARVGSWTFVIGQTVVLTGWIGANTIPGLPHWDESPFILLNLMFSFASAYTAPVVLMSQNRQSDEEREQAANNHLVNVRTAESIELLHRKIDELQARLSIADNATVAEEKNVSTRIEEKTTVNSLPLVTFDGVLFKPLPIAPPSPNQALNLYRQLESDEL